MQQRNLILVRAMSALVFVAASASNAHSTSCIAKPNGQAPRANTGIIGLIGSPVANAGI